MAGIIGSDDSHSMVRNVVIHGGVDIVSDVNIINYVLCGINPHSLILSQKQGLNGINSMFHSVLLWNSITKGVVLQ